MYRITCSLTMLLILAGCASHNQFASEKDLHHHNTEARNFCKQMEDGDHYYQCFDRYLLKGSSVTMHQFLRTKRSLEQAIDTRSS
ncbi:hypothetical protein JCM19235_2636 [Vibrio maritimus]|uniref:Lipoprotein n=1 Tax=Vibrio maritimus TaxID=990268 RepID=A0A090RXA8_9VIBR|nr:hypothetical protein JCM19235_2636 [Vibrio maritimus]